MAMCGHNLLSSIISIKGVSHLCVLANPTSIPLFSKRVAQSTTLGPVVTSMGRLRHSPPKSLPYKVEIQNVKKINPPARGQSSCVGIV